MDSVATQLPARYQFGADRAHTAGRCPPAYVPLAEGAPAVEWSEQDRAEWADACARDAARESGGGW